MFQPTDRQPPSSRSFVRVAPGRRTPFVRCGEKEVYNPASPADMAELRTVQTYRQR
ncbi:hypothetical protein [Actinoplanes sp. RD1]|uniref:hypothetical protein n=1 Tax=Actinoplanes sp. RD1 TaxID=3064538 RepID=UPI0027407513|nr:hypothetical protein [Actinoplanes sp. RD1]